jgi:hypothetical protein
MRDDPSPQIVVERSVNVEQLAVPHGTPRGLAAVTRARNYVIS